MILVIVEILISYHILKVKSVKFGMKVVHGGLFDTTSIFVENNFFIDLCAFGLGMQGYRYIRLSFAVSGSMC